MGGGTYSTTNERDVLFKEGWRAFSFYITKMDLRLKTPFTLVVVGPSHCGKTEWCHNLMKRQEQMYKQKPGNIYYFYNVFQEKFNHMPEVYEFIHGMPKKEKIEEISKFSPNATLYMDDLAEYIDEDIATFFTVKSHHMNLNAVLVQHQLFSAKNPYYRTISLNCRYMVLFKTPRDSSSFETLARQSNKKKWKSMVKIFDEVTSKGWGYLFIDWTANVPDSLRFRTDLFKFPMKIFVPLEHA